MERLLVGLLGAVTVASFGSILTAAMTDLGPNPFALALFGVPMLIGSAAMVWAVKG